MEIYGPEYLRKPTVTDVEKLYRHHEYVRRDHGSNPFILLEAVASQDLWIWHAFFGVAGPNNDINVLYQSPLFYDLKTRRAPEIPFVANGVTYPSGYYLVDGIYPELATLVKTIPEPDDDDHKRILYKKKQESERKDVNSEADLVDVVTIGIPSLYGDGFTKETIRVDPPIVTTSNVVTSTVEKANDGFQTVGKKKKMKGKSKSTNGGQFVGPSVKQNVRYKPKANTSSPKMGVTNVGNTSQSPSMLKTTGKSSKKDNLSMSNSFSALNDEEDDVENVYDESNNLIQNTKADGSSYITTAAG
nr:protein ALP1-like isoform X1 [Tanacetum cinerariifolium]